MIAHLRRWLLAGVIVGVPLVLTVYITWNLITFVDSRVAGIVPAQLNIQSYVSFPVPGYGIVTALAGFIIIGALTTGVLGGMIIRTSERLMDRVPLMRSIYSASKQVLVTVVGSQSDAFREVVLVEYPRKGLWAIGFVTGATKGEIQALAKEELMNVFVPTTPNPTSGFLLFLTRDNVISLDMSVEEAVKLVVSGGIVTPPDQNKERKAISLEEKSKTSG